MRYIVFTFAMIFMVTPTSVFAVCSDTGATVVYVNGVLNSRKDADNSKYQLQVDFQNKFNDPTIKFITGYNPSHLNGAGDFLQSVAQILGGSVTDHDLVTILTQIQPDVTTRKILLVGHSQGTFYTNEMYRYLVANGVPKESIAVYNVATPAHAVEGGGAHLTSSNDSAIQKVTVWAQTLRMPLPLSANANIPVYPDDAQSGYPGHDFIKAYLAGASDHIVSDVSSALQALAAQTSADVCFTAPRLTEAYRADGITLAVSGFVIDRFWYVVASPVEVAQTAGTALGNGAVTSVGLMQQAGTYLGDKAVAAGKVVVNAVKQAGSSLLAFVQSVPVPPASSLVAGTLPLAPAQTSLPQASSDAPVQQGAQADAAPIPQTATEAVVTPSAQAAAATSTADVAFSMATSSAEIITTAAASTSTPEIAAATSTPEIVLAAALPVSHGGGSITGVSAEDLAKQAQEQNAVMSTEQTATSTAGTPATPAQNATATSSADAVSDSNPVVINEIAWMGTKASGNDQWIELYNRTDNAVDLTGWTLESKSGALHVALSKTIPARGYFLLERTASSTTDRTENMVYAGADYDSRADMNLYLKNGTTTIDAVDFGYWPFGNYGEKRTMERVSPYAEGNNYYNWKTYTESFAAPFAKDAQDNDIFGTPGAKNSVSGLYTPTGDIAEDTIWRAKYSPYYVPAPISVLRNATLTIEPGTVVKFAKGGYSYPGELRVDGVLKAEGAENSHIIFTSFLDDVADGIDSNQDATSTSPAPGDWLRIDFLNAGETSTLRYAEIRYGGQGYTDSNGYPIHRGAVYVQNARPTISDSLFDHNFTTALHIEGDAHPVISRNTISFNGIGIRLEDASSTADIIGNTFKNNGTAILSASASDAPLVVKDNIFTDNARNGEFNGYANFNLDNAGNWDTNHKGGFFIQILVSSEQHKTIKADTMPYIIGSVLQVDAGGVLVIEPGAVLKSANPSPYSLSAPIMVRGTLTARGTEAQPIVFTAFADDSDGYDSDNASASPVPGAWENIQFLGASSSDSVLDHAVISYGGRSCPYVSCGDAGALFVQDASPTVSHTRFFQNHAPDIEARGDSQPTLTDNTFL